MHDTTPLPRRPHPPRGRRTVAAAATVLVCGAAVAAGATAHAAAIPPGNTQLLGVSADSATDAWAVGSATTATGSIHSLTLHWNGTRWSKVASPNPSTANTTLEAVKAVSPTDAWAVGSKGTFATGTKTVILHWDGTKWTAVPSPNPSAGTDGVELTAVSATSEVNAWAVGHYENSSFHDFTLVLHWNGTKWKTVASPNPGTGNDELSGVASLSASKTWAVGEDDNTGTPLQTLALRWNGTKWKQVTTPNPTTTANSVLNAISADSATDIWSAGFFLSSDGVLQSLMLHWDGTSWTQVTTPNQASQDSQFNGVAAVSPTDVWGAGFDFTSGATAQTMAEHWDGTSFSQVSSPNPKGGLNPELQAVSAASSGDAWTVGYYTPPGGLPTETLILHWNGTTWTRVAAPN